jgi:CPA1 family monovalent cation:H+ antiporter
MSWLRSLRGGSKTACTHVPDTRPDPVSTHCQECGSSYNLRMCAACGHVGCCESQAGHARRHAQTAQHPVIVAMPIDRGFTWCYVENTYVR